MTDHLKVFISREQMWGDVFAVRMGCRINDSAPWAVARPVQFEVMDDSVAVERAPAFTMSRDDAQAFMDELWHVGIRPTEGTGSAGSLAATQQHLKDMRALVAKAHKVELK